MQSKEAHKASIISIIVIGKTQDPTQNDPFYNDFPF